MDGIESWGTAVEMSDHNPRHLHPREEGRNKENK